MCKKKWTNQYRLYRQSLFPMRFPFKTLLCKKLSDRHFLNMVLNLYICTDTLQNWQPPIKGPCANYRLENVKNGILEDSETKANNGTSKQVGQTTTHPFHPPPDSPHPQVFIIFCTTSQAFSFLLRPPLKMWQWDIKTAFCNLHQHFYHPTTHRHSHHRQPSRSTATTTWFSYLHTYVSVSHKYRYTDTPTPPPTASAASCVFLRT